MKTVNAACAVLYEIAFLLFFVLLILAPIHALATRHFDVVQTIDASHAVVRGDVRTLSPGSTVPLYRFNPDWKVPIGEARVESMSENSALISIDPSAMRWPLGRQSIISREGDTWYISMGSDLGMTTNTYLSVYRDRKSLGQVEIVKVEQHRSIVQVPASMGDVGGLVAGEFGFATQATVYRSYTLSSVEVGVILLALLGYAALYRKAKGSPFIFLGERVRRIPLPKTSLWWLVQVAAGIPFSWFMTKMPLYLVVYILAYLSKHLLGQEQYLYPLADLILPYAWALVACTYYGYLAVIHRSPIADFWRSISYKGKSAVKTVSFKRGFLLWALHLIIVYAFAWTLWGFLLADIQSASAIGFPAPSREAWFEQMKLIVWALTVIGVLIGYGYSVVSILWGKYIRNLDFTVTGWLTNGFCYPLFGVIIWHMIPSFTGLDPIITGGPLQSLMLSLGLLFNVLYMLSIFNLGILFDLMADKGVRTSGFYSVVRHPSYSLEVSMFFVTELVGLAAGVQSLAILMYFFLYWIRAEREDNFMAYSNPLYTPYTVATPYKFIPGIY